MEGYEIEYQNGTLSWKVAISSCPNVDAMLNQVVGYVCGAAEARGDRHLLEKVSAIHASKGQINVTWRCVPTAQEMGYFYKAWSSRIGDRETWRVAGRTEHYGPDGFIAEHEPAVEQAERLKDQPPDGNQAMEKAAGDIIAAVVRQGGCFSVNGEDLRVHGPASFAYRCLVEANWRAIRALVRIAQDSVSAENAVAVRAWIDGYHHTGWSPGQGSY